MGDKKGDGPKVFENFSLGIATGRDAWCYNASKSSVASNMARMITFYNQETDRFAQANPGLERRQRDALVDDFIRTDADKIAWTRALKQDLARDKHFTFEPAALTKSLYRPFTKQWLYFNRRFNEMVYQMMRFFPAPSARNLVIMVKQRWSGSGQFALMIDRVCDLQSDGGAQCFPLYLYDNPDQEIAVEKPGQQGLFGGEEQQTPTAIDKRRDALTDEGLAHFQAAYPGETITKKDVFYYVYGLLHSPDYRERYADNLGKELPRIPCVKSTADFRAFSQAGRDLAELHLNYETVAMYPATVDSGAAPLTAADYRVEKMRHGKKGTDKDLSTVHYNARITVSGIPLEAYEYVVNGKPAIDWVMERQCIKTDKASGIVNDANDWAVETMNNPRYPLELLLRVITVSMETMKIVRALPSLGCLHELENEYIGSQEGNTRMEVERVG